MKKLVLITPLLVFAGVAVAFGFALTRDPSRIPSQLIDRPLPEFDLPAIQGYTEGLSSEEFKGKVTLLNVWGSWCIACKVEHPLLMELARADEALIYGLNWKDKPGDGAAWLARFGDPYARIGDDQEGRVILDLGVTGAPETFIVDQDGMVRYKHIGPITRDDWNDTLKPLIDQLEAQS